MPLLSFVFVSPHPNKGYIKMFEIPTGARHLLIQEAYITSHHLGEYHSPGGQQIYSRLYRVWAEPPGWEARLERLPVPGSAHVVDLFWIHLLVEEPCVWIRGLLAAAVEGYVSDTPSPQ